MIIHSPNGYNSQSPASSKPKARSFFWVSRVCAVAQGLGHLVLYLQQLDWNSNPCPFRMLAEISVLYHLAGLIIVSYKYVCFVSLMCLTISIPMFALHIFFPMSLLFIIFFKFHCILFLFLGISLRQISWW